MKAVGFISGLVLLLRGFGQPLPPAYATVTGGKDGFDLPMEKSERRVSLVLVKINGHGPYRFAVDTCAQGGAHLAADVAKEAGVGSAGSIMANDGTGANRRAVPLYTTETLEAGGVKWTGVIGIEYKRLPRAGEHIDGVLGFGLFTTGVLRFDYAKGRVSYREGELAAGMPDTVPLTFDNGLPSVTATVGDATILAHLDTGSEGGFALPAEDRQRFAPNSPTRVVGKARTQFNEFDVVAAKLDKPVAFGPVNLGEMEAEFLPGLNYANVGEKVMRQFDAIEFDRKHGFVRFWKKSVQPVVPPVPSDPSHSSS